MNKLVGIERLDGNSWVWLYWVERSKAMKHADELRKENPGRRFKVVTGQSL